MLIMMPFERVLLMPPIYPRSLTRQVLDGALTIRMMAICRTSKVIWVSLDSSLPPRVEVLLVSRF